MKALVIICAVAGLILACSASAWAGSVPFDAPGFTYTKVIDSGSDVLRQASFSSDGNLILYSRSATAQRSIELYNRTTGNTTVIATADLTINEWVGNPFFNAGTTKVGSIWNDADGINDLKVYDIASGSTTSWTPPAPTHTTSAYYFCNPSFHGASNTDFVAWDWIDANGAADLFIYDTVANTRTNITNSTQYSDYEPVSNAAGDTIVYWSGETATESTNTAHTLTLVEGNWVKDQNFTPIVGSYWPFWSADEAKIGVTACSSSPHLRDIYIYDSAGNFLLDLTGAGYDGSQSGSGGKGWNFIGANFLINGEYLFTSNADNTVDGRDVWVAVPEPATLSLLALGGVLTFLGRRRRK